MRKIATKHIITASFLLPKTDDLWIISSAYDFLGSEYQKYINKKIGTQKELFILVIRKYCRTESFDLYGTGRDGRPDLGIF